MHFLHYSFQQLSFHFQLLWLLCICLVLFCFHQIWLILLYLPVKSQNSIFYVFIVRVSAPESSTANTYYLTILILNKLLISLDVHILFIMLNTFLPIPILIFLIYLLRVVGLLCERTRFKYSTYSYGPVMVCSKGRFFFKIINNPLTIPDSRVYDSMTLAEVRCQTQKCRFSMLL